MMFHLKKDVALCDGINNIILINPFINIFCIFLFLLREVIL